MLKKENTLWRLIYLSLFLIFIIVITYFTFLNREDVYCEIYPYYKGEIMNNVKVTMKDGYFFENVRVPARDTVSIILHAEKTLYHGKYE